MNAERNQELERTIRDVIEDGVDQGVIEQAAQFAPAMAGKPDPFGGPRKPTGESRFGQPLAIDRDVEAVGTHRFGPGECGETT